MKPYKQGIPTEPGLYWYRETLESEAELVDAQPFIDPTVMQVEYLKSIYRSIGDNKSYMSDRRAMKGFFCPAIPPEVNDE